MAMRLYRHKALMRPEEPLPGNAERDRSICSKEWLSFGR